MELFTQNVVQNAFQLVRPISGRVPVKQNALMVAFVLPVLFHEMVSVSALKCALVFITEFRTKVVTKSKKTVTPGKVKSFYHV